MTRLPIAIIRLNTVDSTNSELARRLDLGAAPGTCVVSLEQTAGRGQPGRSWHSPSGESLYISVSVGSKEPDGLVFASSLAVARAFRGVCAVEAFVKWPNDVLAGGRKIAGILIENSPVKGVWIIGMGLNINNRQFPDDLASIATSAFIETGMVFELYGVECRLFEEINAALHSLESGGLVSVIENWRIFDATPGSQIRIAGEYGDEFVIAAGVDSRGRLVTTDGRIINSCGCFIA